MWIININLALFFKAASLTPSDYEVTLEDIGNNDHHLTTTETPKHRPYANFLG